MATTSTTASLSNLVKALNIVLKYGDIERPTYCEHDELLLLVDPSVISQEDITALDELGFFISGKSGEQFLKSFCYGSA